MVLNSNGCPSLFDLPDSNFVHYFQFDIFSSTFSVHPTVPEVFHHGLLGGVSWDSVFD